jgi:chromate reductase, NAD(P)H dehydrogenase (quinone)
MKLLIIEGGIHGQKHNCGEIVKALKELSPFKETSICYLSEKSPLEKEYCEADAYLFVTGTYWDSCGWPMQKFFEDFTHLECDSRIMGKPAGVIVLCHTVGGKSVLSRLQGVLSCQGYLIPPLTGMVLARDSMNSNSEDSWSLADMDTVLQNLHKASIIQVPWVRWPVDRGDFEKTWVDLDGMQ